MKSAISIQRRHLVMAKVILMLLKDKIVTMLMDIISKTIKEMVTIKLQLLVLVRMLAIPKLYRILYKRKWLKGMKVHVVEDKLLDNSVNNKLQVRDKQLRLEERNTATNQA